MARAKKTTKKVEKIQVQGKQSRFPNFLLALTFVIVVLLLISLFFKSGNTRFSPGMIAKLFTRSNSQPNPEPSRNKQVIDRATAGEDYIVKEGDSLWMIAEEAYGSGFNYADIAKANKLASPGQIEVGQHITLPKAEAKQPTRGEIISQSAPTTIDSNKSEYIVQRGDSLWTIAVKKYNDGFQWTRIAEANHLVNPRVIHAGNRFIIPS